MKQKITTVLLFWYKNKLVHWQLTWRQYLTYCFLTLLWTDSAGGKGILGEQIYFIITSIREILEPKLIEN
ncbi:MAG: hypothetical protein KAW02_06575 [candidate division Zixibacteria bacterium]|nr:hypothetical protein [candidate division Zixibacteria bacterium]